MLLGELGRFPVDVHLKMRMLCYWYKLVNGGNDHKYASVMYRFSLNMYESGKYQPAYITYVKKLLDELGLHGIWLNQKGLDFSIDWFKEKVNVYVLWINIFKSGIRKLMTKTIKFTQITECLRTVLLVKILFILASYYPAVKWIHFICILCGL